jgi:uncharacterized membrane protein YfcA
METDKLLLLLGVIVFVALFYFLLLPRLSMKQQSGMVFRAVVFFALIGYLTYDFYTKEKYWYILVLVAGSIAFAVMIRNRGKQE